jgi:peptide/nickel transport system ATP-binding protein
MNQALASRGNGSPLLELTGVQKWFPVRQDVVNDLMGRQRSYVKAVDGVTVTVNQGEILGLVGQSGSGKSTLGELICRLQDPTAGSIVFRNQDVAGLRTRQLKDFRRHVQIIFQDPYATLNPRFSIYQTVVEALLVNGIRARSECDRRVRTALKRAGLEPDDQLLAARPHQLSGGQRQRVAIARAIVLEPDLIVADEPVSMLDVSIRSGILNLLRELKSMLGLSIVFISHDLSTIQYLCDRVAIMYLGKIVELGPTERIIQAAYHPYSRALLRAVPVVDPDIQREQPDDGDEPPSSIELPSGCRYAPLCSYATAECTRAEPELVEVAAGHFVRCIHPQDEPLWG